jgi:hypothetical protein
MSHHQGNRKRSADDAFNPFAGFDEAVIDKLNELNERSGITSKDIEPYLVDDLKALKPASAIRVLERCMLPGTAMASPILAAFMLQEKVETSDRLRLDRATHLADRCKKAEAEVHLLRERARKEEGRRATLEAERDGLQDMCTSAEATCRSMQADIDRLRGERDGLQDMCTSSEATRRSMQADIDRLRGERDRLRDASSATPSTSTATAPTGLDALPAGVKRRIRRVISPAHRGHRLTELAFDKRVVDGILMMNVSQFDKFVEFLTDGDFASIVNPSAYMTSRIHALLKS